MGGFAAVLAESLWLSVNLAFQMRLRLGGVAAESFSCSGKAKPFRKDSGKAAPKNLSKTRSCSFANHRVINLGIK
jgi:hypothetical protein